jgi:hypothetical protein
MEETTHLYQQMLHNQFQPASRLKYRESPPPFTVNPDESTQMLVEYALHKIHTLRATIDEASAELHHIEHFIKETMLNHQSL